jgi:hypothetical protein
MTSWDVVFVTGDRHWSDHVALQEALQHHAPGTWLVEGGAPGADHVAKVVGMAMESLRQEGGADSQPRDAAPPTHTAEGGTPDNLLCLPQ